MHEPYIHTPFKWTQLKSMTDVKFSVAVHFSLDGKRINNSPFSKTGFAIVDPTFIYL